MSKEDIINWPRLLFRIGALAHRHGVPYLVHGHTAGGAVCCTRITKPEEYQEIDAVLLDEFYVPKGNRL